MVNSMWVWLTNIEFHQSGFEERDVVCDQGVTLVDFLGMARDVDLRAYKTTSQMSHDHPIT